MTKKVVFSICTAMIVVFSFGFFKVNFLDLPIAVRLIEHIHKVRVLENVRYFRTCQQIFDILR